MTYIQERDFASDRCSLFQTGLISLAHDDISKKKFSSFGLRLLSFLHTPLAQGMVQAVKDSLCSKSQGTFAQRTLDCARATLH